VCQWLRGRLDGLHRQALQSAKDMQAVLQNQLEKLRVDLVQQTTSDATQQTAHATQHMQRSHTGCNVPTVTHSPPRLLVDWVRSTGTPNSDESRSAATALRSSVKRVTEWSERMFYVVWHVAWHVAGYT
jgi:hypothetical protein